MLLTAFSFSQMGCSNEAQSKEPEEEAEAGPVIPVEAVAASTGDISAFFVGTASLEAEEEAEVVAKQGGIVSEIFVEEGQYVRAGQPLGQIHDAKAGQRPPILHEG